jgi:hypothetical protein
MHTFFEQQTFTKSCDYIPEEHSTSHDQGPSVGNWTLLIIEAYVARSSLNTHR